MGTVEAGSKADATVHLDGPAGAVAEAYRSSPIVNEITAQFPRTDEWLEV
jgi:hypothetical protein